MNPVQTPVSVQRDIGGRPLIIETGRVARQSAGAVTVRQGDTVVLVPVTSGPGRPGQGFFPLTVDYRESMSAAGKFPGGFFKREARPSTKETLVSRVIDRPIRPLFPDGFMDEVLVSPLVLSADAENDPDVLAMVGASAALAISGLPWDGPIGACRVGKVGPRFVVNPTHAERKESELDLVMASTTKAITMVEAGAQELGEDAMLEALFEGERACREIAEMILELREKCGVTPATFTPKPVDEALKAKVDGYYDRVKAVNYTPGKHARSVAIKKARDEAIAELTTEIADEAEKAKVTGEIKSLWEELVSRVIRTGILEDKLRNDGRGPTDIRPITIEVGFLPRTHGSALFTRGETQAIVSMTLGTVMDDQRVEGLLEPTRQKFMLHYNFPAYSVGESWAGRGPKRREIGHGNLAERSLAPVVPPFEQFPYTVRIRSDITESNGSSSMASVCGGTLALMDGGVPIRKPVAGIAMGLVSEGDRYVILSDILGSEDHCGDMDFKVSGTQTGITALQMDLKMDGLSRELMGEALQQARQGRIYILKQMLSALQRPRAELSPFAPVIVQVPIDPEKIGALIGPGGKTIRKIQEETQTNIEIDEERKIVCIAGKAGANMDSAEAMVRALASEVQIGQRFTGRVVSIRDFGCFVEMFPGMEGLVHVSELAEGYVERVRDVVNGATWSTSR
ncbi:MAG: polyribonucleotide nucleotidyltransferase [Planctomycetes bacterium]|nr:polyribonucleotide nucleotidyltransferase [Planctomycetota bacterium]